MALTPWIGPYANPFLTFFPAVLLSAWYVGFYAAFLTILLSASAAAFFFSYPAFGFSLPHTDDEIGLLFFLVVGVGMAFLSRSQRRALDRSIQEASQRKVAELQERAERERFETTLASIGDGVITTDVSGNVSFMNTVAEALTGWKRNEAVAKPIETVFHVVDERTRNPVELPTVCITQECLAGKFPDHSIVVARDGKETAVDDSASLIRDYEGRTSGAVLVFRDVGERRRVEKEREASIRTAHQLAAIVESSDDAILSKDLDLRITSWNRAAEQMFGYTAREVIGQSVTVIIPESRWNEEESVMQLIRRGEKVEQNETERRRKDGSVIPVSLSISPIHDSAGVVVGASTIMRDITRRLALEKEKQAREAAEEANRAKDEFLAMLSHELRNPLGAIMGWVSMLKQGQVRVERIPHVLGVIEKNAKTESRLVESLLDSSRIAAGKLDLNMEAVDLASLIEIVVESIRPAADTKGVILDWAPADGPVIVVGDSVRLQQVFSNLLMNAVKFTPRGGHVSIRLNRVESQAQVQIVDSGEGILPDFLPVIFERFRQEPGQKGRGAGGLGLGLAIVRALADAHGATITAESQGKGKGSAFTFTVPIPAILPENIQTAALQGSREEPVIAGTRILVVDDEIDVRELVAITLKFRGATVQEASTAGEALDSIRREKPDLLISDIGMPNEDGYVLIRKLRAWEGEQGQPRLPAIALTGLTAAADKELALSAGYDLHLAKPVPLAELLRAISKLSPPGDLPVLQPKKSA
jgi:PAS domain S-box-containing protein